MATILRIHLALVVAGTLSAPAMPLTAEPLLPFQDPALPAEERIADLLGRMTLEEKIDCMGSRAAVPRLGVVGSPHIEGYHGVAQGGADSALTLRRTVQVGP